MTNSITTNREQPDSLPDMSLRIKINHKAPEGDLARGGLFFVHTKSNMQVVKRLGWRHRPKLTKVFMIVRNSVPIPRP